jgi:hypothetical protein
MITTLTFEDLKQDAEFLYGLQNQQFVLVLGAGFSYDVKSLSSIQENIPLGSDFTTLTNTKFDQNVSDYNTAANLWGYHSKKDPQLSDEFKNLFLADPVAFKYKQFQRLFIPKWHNIYTLNFDNVLDLAQENLKVNYPIFSYPINPSNVPNSISHLHGRITDAFDFDDIVFSPQDYNASIAHNHSLYTSLHGNIKTEGKDLIVIGTQFKERRVLKMFFEGLDDVDFKIYHFELKNDDTRAYPEFTEKDYNFIKIKGTHEVLDFLEDNKHAIHSYDLEGAKIIDRAFKEELKTKSFTPHDFYISKLSQNCQWYGCNEGWAIKRELYENLKKTVVNSFKEERTSNVSAVIHGVGGSGKSTQLRILALELSSENFKVVWIENFDTFNDHSIEVIRDNEDQNFLVLIEDWYRLSDLFRDSYQTVFKKLVKLPNVRMVIGDRTLKSTYMNWLFNPEVNEFKISAKENKDVIGKIALKIDDWQEICEDLYENQSIQQIPLFSILFIISKIHSQQLDASKLRVLNIKGHFAKIVRSDVKRISQRYKGIAKGLVYLASFYKKYKITITTNALLTIAQHFEPEKNLELLSINGSHSEIDIIISSYITEYALTTKTKWLNNTSVIQFNHDTLAEDGLSKAILQKWLPSEESGYQLFFDETQQFKILNLLIDIGDDLTATKLFYQMVVDQTSKFWKNKPLVEKYVEKFKSKNQHNFDFYLVLVSNQSFLSLEERKIAAADILDQFESHNISSSTVNTALQLLSETSAGIDYSLRILKRFESEEIDHQIIGKCLSVVAKEPRAIPAAYHILERHRNQEMSYQIVSTSLNIIAEEDTSESIALEILGRFKSEPIAKEIVNSCLSIVKDTPEGEDFALYILKEFKYGEISYDIMDKCLSIAKDQELVHSIANDLLKKFETDNRISYQLINKCLKILSQEKEGKDFALGILERAQTIEINIQVISRSLQNIRDIETSLVDQYLTEENYEKKYSLIYHSLNNYAHFKKDHFLVNRIIEDNRRKGTKETYHKYKELMKIPFFFNKLWLHEFQDIYKKWRTTNREIVSSILYASHEEPLWTKRLSLTIIKRWEREINFQIEKKMKFNLYHIINSLKNSAIDDAIVNQTIDAIIHYNLVNNHVIPEDWIRKIEATRR